MPKTVNVRVSTMDSEMEFAIQNSTTGKQLFDQVVRTIGLRETWYFGLHFTDTSGLTGWLELKKKVQSQDVKKETPMQFKLLAKYYPEDVSEELIQEITRYMFYLQVRESVLAENYYCPAETAVLLASYASQAKFGDYDPKVHKAGFLEKERVLPPSVKSKHTLTAQQWEDRIVTWYTEHKGMTRDDAILEYLKISQDLEMYGINYYDITNKKGSALLLGIDALGINIYAKEDRLTPKIGFPWSDIRHVSFTNKKFVIKPVDKTAPDFSFYVAKMKINKRILDLCMGNHELYMRRRKPDSIEVQQMKAQAREEKAAKEAERMNLQKERQAREDAERQQKDLEGKVKEYEEEMIKAQQELEISRREALLLEELMRKSEQERQEMEEAQRNADQARRAAEAAADAEKSEREQKEREAEEAQALLEEKQREAQEREEEMRRLEIELEDARRQMLEREQELEEAQKLKEAQKLEAQKTTTVKATTVSSVNEAHSEKKTIVVVENGDYDYDDDSGDKTSQNLLEDDESLSAPDDDRVAQVEKDERMNEQLKSLGNELDENKVESAQTKTDVIYRKNQSEGRDKYKTLKQIRAGNTKSRIEVFESM